MNLKNSRGITLIALIVTIIVLIIIAGISIASLTSDNGILRQTNAAKVEQIEGTAREQLKLAVSAMRLAIAEAGAQDNSYKANENAGLIQAKLKEILNDDKEGLNGTFDVGGNALVADASATEITISYTGDDYKNACNDENAQITYSIGLGQRTIELTREAAYGITGADGKDVNINISDSNYLVDNVEIGDYVDLGDGLEYTNKGAYYPEFVNGTYDAGLAGWRVLSKTGKGKTGTIKLVSAGTPLTYYHTNHKPETSITDLSDLSKKLTLSSSGSGFRKSGFVTGTTDTEVDMKTLWATNKKIDASTAHALTIDEVVKSYNDIMGVSKTASELYNLQMLKTSDMLTLNQNISRKTYNLIVGGTSYWLGGGTPNNEDIWYVLKDGTLSYDTANGANALRVVVSLYSGVEISETNIGNGSSSDSAYTIK